MITNNKTKEVYDFLSSINKIAYRDVFMLSCQVLSKNPFSNNFLIRYIRNEKINKQKLSFVFNKLTRYYVKSLKHFIRYIIDFIEYLFSKSQFRYLRHTDQIILIDMPFLIYNIKKSSNFSDNCFPGLADILLKNNLRYAYIPFFVGPKKSLTMFKVFKILKEKETPVITEYQLLNLWDILNIFLFIILYPIKLFLFIRKLDDGDYKQELLKDEILNTLDDVAFINFARYLFGKKISAIPYKNIKIISWDENQISNKNLYKGLREGGRRIKIYGAQLLTYSKNVLNIITDENEAIFGIIPDKILVNGPQYIPENTRLNYKVGPSLRYRRVFNSEITRHNMKNILVLLPYYKDEIRNILQMLNKIPYSTEPIFIKPHPITDINEFKSLLPSNSVLVNEDMYELFKKTKIMISGGASGTFVESVSLGIPTIFINNPKSLHMNPLLEEGKGIIWEEVNSVDELIEKINKLERNLAVNSLEIANLAYFYKTNFFCEPTEKNIVEAFDLLSNNKS